MEKMPSNLLKLLSPVFGKVDNVSLEGTSILRIKNNRKDATGKDVSGFFDVNAVTAAVSPVHPVTVNNNIAPSLGFVDNGKGKQIPVVNLEDLCELFEHHWKTQSAVPDYQISSVSNGSMVECAVQSTIKPTEGQGMVEVQKPPTALTMLPANAFIVDSKDQCMYGKYMKDINIGGFSVVSDAVIRFRRSDNKPLTGDLLVAVGRYGKLYEAQETIKRMVKRKDHKVNDLKSFEIDNKLTEDPVCYVFDIGTYDFLISFCTKKSRAVLVQIFILNLTII